MKRFTRRTLLIQAGLLTLGLLAACCREPTGTPTTLTSAPSALAGDATAPTGDVQPTTSSLAKTASPSQAVVTIDAIDNCFTRTAQELSHVFEQAEDIRVTWRNVLPWRDYLRFIPERAAAGDLDIIQAPIGLFIRAWAQFGYIRPLDTYLTPATNFLADIFPGALSACRIKESLYGLPFAASPGESLMLYNRNLFDAADIAYPQEDWALADLALAAEQLNSMDQYGHLARFGYVPAYTLPGQLAMLRAFGIELLDEERNQAASPEQLLPLLAWYQEHLHDTRVFPKPFELPFGPLTLFYQGKAAMLRQSFGTLNELTLYAEWPGAILLPPLLESSTHGSYLTGMANCLAASCPKPAVSVEWCRYLSSAINGVLMFRQGCGVPGCRTSGWLDSSVVNSLPISPACAQLAALARPEPVPANLRQTDLYDTWLTTSEPFWQGNMTDEECAEKLTAALQHVLDLPVLTTI